MNKTCTKCGESRSVSEFYVQDKRTGRLNPWCKACYREWYRNRGGYTTTRTAECIWCHKSFETPYARSKFCSTTCKQSSAASRRRGNGAIKPERKCPWCGKPVPVSMRIDAKFCSEECSSHAHSGTRKLAQRAGRERRNPDAGLLDRNAIAERDKFRCGICGGRVDMTLSHPDPMYGSIDHIVPVAAGGTDDPANLQLAHLRCNLSKRDRGGGEQLRLIG